MDEILGLTPRTYRLASTLIDGSPRYIVQQKNNLAPTISLSIYEQFLSHNMGSHHSVRGSLDRLMYVYTWAQMEDIDLDMLILNSVALSPAQVRHFAHWLGNRNTQRGTEVSKISISNYNAILSECSSMLCWFIRQYWAHSVGDLYDPQIREFLTRRSRNQTGCIL